MSTPTNPSRFGRTATGLAVIGFPLAGLSAALIDSHEGTDTPAAELYEIAAAHSDAIFVSALVFMLSAVLTVPAAFGLMSAVRDRGTTLARIGAAFMTLGAFGHMGFATWQIMITRVPADADRPAMLAYLERQNGATTAVLLPLLLSIVVGVVLMVIALYRAGLVPRWFFVTTMAMVAFDLVLNSTSLQNSKAPLVFVWAAFTVLFGYLGGRLLGNSRTTDDAPVLRTGASL